MPGAAFKQSPRGHSSPPNFCAKVSTGERKGSGARPFRPTRLSMHLR